MSELPIKDVLDNRTKDYIVKEINGLYLIKYNKSALTEENVSSLGLFRSVITDGKRILSFAPPKSVNYNSFIVENDFDNSNISEFIDGTMVNVFYNTKNINKDGILEAKWELATRSNIGANCRFNLNSKKTFRQMFVDACVPNGENIDDFFNELNKEYCYSFVVQHPENRIVHKVNTPTLYLTNIYKFEENIVHPVSYKNQEDIISEHIKQPRNITELYPNISNWEYINLLCSGEQIGYELQGFVITNNKNERTKIRNIEYEKIKRIRGNNPKLQYQFLELYKLNKLNEYLYYFPENKEAIEEYKNSFYNWSEIFYNLYIECFIERRIYLKECPFEYKPLLYALHKHYIEVLRPNSEKVNFTFIKKYIKTIPTEKIMFSMNYKYRELKQPQNKLNNHMKES